MKVLLEATSILLGVLIAPIYNFRLPKEAHRLGLSSRMTISGVTALNYLELGLCSYRYKFIRVLFYWDEKHLENAQLRARRLLGIGEKTKH